MSGAPDAVERIGGTGREGREEAPRAWCLTEMSVAGLIAGALGISAVLWLAVLAVI